MGFKDETRRKASGRILSFQKTMMGFKEGKDKILAGDYFMFQKTMMGFKAEILRRVAPREPSFRKQ